MDGRPRIWQELATYDGTNNWVSDEGVFWRSSNGSTWSTWGNEDLYVGQTVQFQFNMHKQNQGTHYADHLKAWVDWDKDGFDDPSDVIMYEEEILYSTNPRNNSSFTDTSYLPPNTANFSYFSDIFTIDELMTGEIWLRARVTCSHSLTSPDAWQNQWDGRAFKDIFKATGDLYQGEVEEWSLKVNSVPEPATILLFGFGLLGLSGLSRKKK